MGTAETRGSRAWFDSRIIFDTVSPLAYWSTVALAAGGCAALCGAARRRPGPWRISTARVLAMVLGADAVSYSVGLAVQGTWSAKTSLPLALCNVGVLVATAACWWRRPLLVELTYFWGLAGTLQAVITPDLNVGFPHLVFFQYLVGHVGIVVAALFLVVGMGIAPRRHAVARVYAITLGYTAAVGIVDALTGANYMFLRSPPAEWTLLRVLGPWPWYVVEPRRGWPSSCSPCSMPRSGHGAAGPRRRPPPPLAPRRRRSRQARSALRPPTSSPRVPGCRGGGASGGNLLPAVDVPDVSRRPMQERGLRHSSKSRGPRKRFGHMDDSTLLAELLPTAERLVDRHLGMAKEWFPHDLVEWRPPGATDPEAVLKDGIASALFVNVLTEDNLPYYFASIDNLFGRDGAWGYWTRRWTAEEGRHSIVIRDYLIMSGHIDPVTLERARMTQVTGGVTPQPTSIPDPFAYLALQELATRIRTTTPARPFPTARGTP